MAFHVILCIYSVRLYCVLYGGDQTILHSLTSTIQLFTINKQHMNINKPLKMIVSVYDSWFAVLLWDVPQGSN